jgi:hypothetical protein
MTMNMNMKKEEKLEWTEHLGKAFEAFVRDLRGVLPEETYTHLQASRKELLLALRSLIDREIEKLEEEPKKARKVEVK